MRMSNMELKNSFETNYQKILPTISETLQQLFMREFSISMNVTEDDNIAVSLAGEKYPSLAITLESEAGPEMKHLLLMEPEMTLQLYSWMIGDDPEETVTEAHIEGLQEAVNQITSQVQILFDGGGSELSIDNLKLELHEDSSALLENIPGDEGLQATYIVNAEEKTYSINHYVWVTGGALESGPAAGSGGGVNVSKADFENFMTAQGAGGDPESMDLLLDVELEVIAELGKKIIPIKDLLKLGTGSVVELEKSAGEPLDLFINGRKFGEGEVVVVEDHFGIRITQLAGKKEKDTE